MNKNGKFIVIEGGEGSGKSTIIKELRKHFANNYKVLVTREPGGDVVGEEIRDIILNNKISYKTEALLFAASRAEHINNIIIPGLAEYDYIFSDRFVYSSIVYQGIGRDLGIDTIEKLNNWILNGITPDLIIYLQIDPEIGLARVNSRSEKNRIDQENILFHQKIKKGFDQILSDKALIIDATLSIEEISTIIIDKINSL